MHTAVYKIADKAVQITSVFESVHRLCRDYRWDGPADFTANVTQDDIARERAIGAREDEREGLPIRQNSDEYWESLAVYRKIAEHMLDFDTVLFHGSALAMDGVGYLFTAKSGTGKSTHTRLWRQAFGDRVVMVNDDKPLLKITDSGVFVCGTPWDGVHRLSSNVILPLKAICLLERGPRNSIVPICAKEALPMLLQQSYRSPNPARMLKLMELMNRLTQQLKFYRLTCNMEPEAALTAWNGLAKS